MRDASPPTSVKELFTCLGQHGLRIGQPERSDSFDQFVQTAHTPDVNIRFVRDRGDEFLEVGCGENWFSPDLLRLVLFGGQLKDEAIDLLQDSLFLKQHYSDIAQMFSIGNRAETIRRLEDMRIKKARCMFPGKFADADRAE